MMLKYQREKGGTRAAEMELVNQMFPRILRSTMRIQMFCAADLDAVVTASPKLA